MNIQEAVIIVAEFDGWKKYRTTSMVKEAWHDQNADEFIRKHLYLEELVKKYLSLDALVDVWEAAKLRPIPYPYPSFWVCNIEDMKNGNLYQYDNKYKTLPEAALIATAKAIQEMGPKRL